jgi:hypothetical protein
MTPYFFLLVFAVGSLLAIFRDPIYGLYTYIFTLYMSPSANWWGSLVPDVRYLFIIGALTLAVTLFRGRTPGRRSWLTFFPSRMLLCLIAYMWLQTLWAHNVDIHLGGTITFTKHLLIFFLTYQLIDTRERMQTFLILHIVGCFYFGYLALGAGGGRLETVGGPVGGSNELGVHVSTAAIIGGIMWLTYTGWVRHVITVAMPFIINALILTLSRGAFLGLVAGGLTAGFFIPGEFRKRFIWLSCLALVLLAVLAHDQFTERLWNLYESLTTEEVQIDKSAGSRVAIFKAGIEIGKNNLLGSGYKATPALSARYLDPRYHSSPGVGRSAHNTFAAMFAEHGIPGTLLYFSIVAWVLRHLLKPSASAPSYGPRDRALSVGMSAALVGMYVSGNFSNNADMEAQYWILALICALLANVQRDAHAVEASPKEASRGDADATFATEAHALSHTRFVADDTRAARNIRPRPRSL